MSQSYFDYYKNLDEENARFHNKFLADEMSPHVELTGDPGAGISYVRQIEMDAFKPLPPQDFEASRELNN